MLQNPSILAAVIGVAGTLSGVILGVTLTRIMSSGRIKVFVNSYGITYSEKDKQGGHVTTDILTPQSEKANLIIDLDIYNSASEHRIMRDISLLLRFKKLAIKIGLKDLSTRRMESHMIRINDFKSFTLTPKSITNLKLMGTLTENLHELEFSSIFFRYINSNQKEKIKTIKNCG